MHHVTNICINKQIEPKITVLFKLLIRFLWNNNNGFLLNNSVSLPLKKIYFKALNNVLNLDLSR